MINKEEVIDLINSYLLLEEGFKFPLNKKAHPLLLHAAKYSNKPLSILDFSHEFLTYGQALPRVCGKSKFLKDMAEYLQVNGYTDLLDGLIGSKDGYIMYNKEDRKAIVLQGDLEIPERNPGWFVGLGIRLPPLRIILATPVMKF